MDEARKAVQLALLQAQSCCNLGAQVAIQSSSTHEQSAFAETQKEGMQGQTCSVRRGVGPQLQSVLQVADWTATWRLLH
jgi:hypothetical protein